jgi:hypothetical protein
MKIRVGTGFEKLWRVENVEVRGLVPQLQTRILQRRILLLQKIRSVQEIVSH